MDEYVLLECNRLTAGIDESTDDFKNKWTNNVNSTGLVVSKGDMITMEAAAINTIGSTEDTMEFLGQDNENGYVDNKVTLDFAFYFNNAGKNLVSLPLRQQQTFMSYVPGKTVFPPLPSSAPLLLNRGLGEPYFAIHSTNTTDPPSDIDTFLPYQNLVYYVELGTTQIGSGFRINGVYNTETTSGENGSGLQIQVLDVVTEGSTAGIPSKFRVHDVGFGYEPAPPSLQLRTTTASDGGSNPSAPQTFNVRSYLNGVFQSKNINRADGRRYFLGKPDYTGASCIPFTGSPSHFQPTFVKRVSSVTLEVPVGLSTPDNIATLLTEQLHRPTRLGTDYNEASYISGNYLSITTLDEGNTIERIPPIVETPTFKAMPCNNGVATKGLLNGQSGIRSTYYGVVAYANPDKLEGLQHSRQFHYGLTNDLSENQLHSGLAQQATRGDFGNQTIGNLGLNQVVMMNTPSSGGTPDVVVYQQGGWVVTNAYYTEENVSAIARGFRKAERYFGYTTNTISNNQLTALQLEDLAVPLDIGLYDDQYSNGRPLSGTNATGQRNRYKTYLEFPSRPNHPDDPTTTTSYTPVDFQHSCVGTIPFKHLDYQDDGVSPVFNDGHELSSLVVTSRWQDDYNFKLNPTDTSFAALHSIIEGETDTARFSIPGVTLQNTFIQNYTDDRFGGLTFDTMIGWAKHYDVAVIPVFPKAGTIWSKFGGRPFIAYRSHLPLGAGTYDVRVNGYEKWQIDKHNCTYGIQLGLDLSFTRLNACLVYNVNFADKTNLKNMNFKGYSNVVMAGAVNPNIQFDPTVSRFEMSGLNTPLTVGNGLPTQLRDDAEPNTNPEQQVYSVNVSGSITQTSQDTNKTSGTINAVRVVVNDQQQQDTTIIDSLSGLAIDSITLESASGILTRLSYYGQGVISSGVENQTTFLPQWNNSILHNTVLGKMGYTPDQFLTRLGHTNAVFNNELTFLGSTDRSARDTMFNVPSPLTTGTFISSAEYQPSGANSAGFPLYDCSINNGLEARPSVSQGSITAFTLPQKLDYPYLCVYSSIVSAGTNTAYYGGSDGKSKVNCVGYITRFNNEGDFFYQVASDYTFTATKDFVLTDVDTDIRLPNGSRPKLQPHSSVIYKIIKPAGVGS